MHQSPATGPNGGMPGRPASGGGLHALGKENPPRSKLLRTYMPTLPLGEARDALQKWGEEIDRVLGVAVSAQGPDAAVPRTAAPISAVGTRSTIDVCPRSEVMLLWDQDRQLPKIW